MKRPRSSAEANAVTAFARAYARELVALAGLAPVDAEAFVEAVAITCADVL